MKKHHLHLSALAAIVLLAAYLLANAFFPAHLKALPGYGYTKKWGVAPDGNISGYSVAHDSHGNVFLTGTYFGTIDFNPGPGTDFQSSPDTWNTFLTKINSDGSYGFTYSYLGTNTAGGGNYIAIDKSDNIYLGGYFRGAIDFDLTAGTDLKTSLNANGSDAFITKINANGTYGYTYTYGSAPGTSITAIDRLAIDSSGNVFAAGQFNGTVDFNPLAPTDTRIDSSLYQDAFLTKLNADGSYGYTNTWGGTGNALPYGLAFKKTGSVMLGLIYKGSLDFDPTAATDSRTSAGDYDIGLITLSASNTYQTGISMGNTTTDLLDSLRVDSSGNTWITGSFSGTEDFDSTAGIDNQSSQGSNQAAFTTKINSDGTYGKTIVYSSAGGDVIPDDVMFDSAGNVYLLGTFDGAVDFDPTAGTDQQTSQGYGDSYLAVFKSDGTYSGTQILTGNNSVVAVGGDVDGADNVYITGYFDATSTDFDPTSGVDNQPAVGFYDMFLTKLNGPPPPSPPPSNSTPAPAAPLVPAKTTITSSPVAAAQPTATDNGVVLNQLPDFSTNVGASVGLTSGTAVMFSLPSDTSTIHTATIQSVGTDFVDLTIASDPIKLRLSVGDTRTVDVDRNGNDDLSVTLASLNSGKANLQFRLLKEVVPVKAGKTSASTVLAPAKSSVRKTVYLAGGAVLLLVAMAYGYWIYKHHRRHLKPAQPQVINPET